MAVKPVSVTQLNGYIKRILQTDPLLGNVSVTGEISNLKFHSSGHVYFSLKDEKSKLSCFLAGDKLKDIHYDLSDGMEITASGYIYLYERGGSYSLNIRDIEVKGVGDLSIAFEKLKEKLLKEGLFDEDNKKELPFFPEKIAVITSETGAAVRDILKIIKNKNDYIDILIYPVLVQGPAAAGEIAEAIAQVNEQFPEVDVMIVGRGGGSMEELWAFNEEIVARSIAASEIPVISAVGHETDFTISDFAADKRAETPTAAAEMAVPNTSELRSYLNQVKDGIIQAVQTSVKYKEMQLQGLQLETFRRDLESKIVYEQMRIENLKTENQNRVEGLVEDFSKVIQTHKITLESLNPKNIMQRGYGAILNKDRKFVGSIEKLKKGDPLTLVMEDGTADCQVKETRRSDHYGG